MRHTLVRLLPLPSNLPLQHPRTMSLKVLFLPWRLSKVLAMANCCFPLCVTRFPVGIFWHISHLFTRFWIWKWCTEHGQEWYKSNGAAIHGNINPATIGIVPLGAYLERLHAHAPRGFLLSARDIPPNPVFQSVKALAALSISRKAERDRTGVASGTLNYSPRHFDDLESFYYVLLYLCIPYTAAGLGETSVLQDSVQGDGHAFNTINTEIFLEDARFVTGLKLAQGNLNAIGVSDLSWITHPMAVRSRKYSRNFSQGAREYILCAEIFVQCAEKL